MGVPGPRECGGGCCRSARPLETQHWSQHNTGNEATDKVRPGGRSLPDCSKKAPAAAATVVRRGHSTSFQERERERETALS